LGKVARRNYATPGPQEIIEDLMITKIEALNYRCLRYISQELGNFHVLAGPNASGKSTFLDVIALMSDVVNKGPLEAIQSRAANYRDLFWMHEGDSFELAIEAAVPEERLAPLKDGTFDRCRYELRIGTLAGGEEIGIARERLWLFRGGAGQEAQVELFPRSVAPPASILWPPRKAGAITLIHKVPDGNDNFYSETGGWDHVYRLGPQRSALKELLEDVGKFPVSTWFKKALSEGVQVLALNSKVMRRPSPPGLPRRMLPDGSNLPWALEQLRKMDEARLREWLEHIRIALPDVADVRTIERDEDRHRYLVLEYANGLQIPSWLVSDGTLRFLALTLLPYLTGMEGIYLIEEPENGIHPKAVEPVYQSLSSVYEGQVLLATHSPIFLSVTKPPHILCFALNDEGAADVVEGPRHPRLRSWRNEVPLGDLFAAGVLG
jgi:energy-coupling factor transporter ATP-binding protein EcfA2